jgi:hypothetical protein
MTLGALIDAGVDPQQIETGIRSLGLGELELAVRLVKKCGFKATYVQILHPPEHAHRHLHHIEAMIDGAAEIDPAAKELAKRIFRGLGEAEAKVHGTTIEKVHFHEVGAVDSIADIVGTAIGLTALEIDAVAASAVPTGSGSIEIAHGRVSVPAPATAELLRGVPLAESAIEAELTTPTGAAILQATAGHYGPLPSLRIDAIGYGAGTRDFDGQANVLRLIVGQSEPPPSEFASEVDRVAVVETNIDNVTAEDLATCVESLWETGALDVYQLPCQMKKGRQGTQLTVICAASRLPAVQHVLLSRSGSIGVRHYFADRRKLIRRSVQVETPLGSVRGKCVWSPEGYWRLSVEHDDLVTVARSHRTTLEHVRQLAQEAFTAAPPLPPPA